MNAFRREVNWSPDNIRAWYDLGVTLEKLKREDEAKIAFTKVDQLTNAAASISTTQAVVTDPPGTKTGPIATKSGTPES
jgi:Flp pilus assembly protein TadD